MSMPKHLLLIIMLLLSVTLSKAQCPKTKAFEFEYKWGTYGHYQVSSKDRKVYVKVQHPDIYEGVPIQFTPDDKKKVWDMLNHIDFFSYPNEYSPQPPKDTLPEFEVIYADIIDTTRNENSSEFEYIYPENDTIWRFPKMYTLEETSIPFAEYSITVYFLGKKKTVQWRGNQELREFGSKQEIIDPRFENLYKLGNLIYEITKKKEGFKKLPESGLIYY